MYYALSLNTGSLDGSIYLNTALMGLVEIPANILCYFTLSWRVTGRRLTCGGSLILAGLSLFISAPFIVNGTFLCFVYARLPWLLAGLLGHMTWRVRRCRYRYGQLGDGHVVVGQVVRDLGLLRHLLVLVRTAAHRSAQRWHWLRVHVRSIQWHDSSVHRWPPCEWYWHYLLVCFNVMHALRISNYDWSNQMALLYNWSNQVT